MKIEQGGQTESLQDEKIERIDFYHEHGRVNMMINKSSLSYFSLEEAVKLKRELEEAIIKSVRSDVY